MGLLGTWREKKSLQDVASAHAGVLQPVQHCCIQCKAVAAHAGFFSFVKEYCSPWGGCCSPCRGFAAMLGVLQPMLGVLQPCRVVAACVWLLPSP